MKSKKIIVVLLVLLIAALSLFAAFSGVFHSGSQDLKKITTVRGQELEMVTSGVYKYNSKSLATEGGVAWDLVTLFFGIPLLLISLFFFWRNSMRGKLLLAGTLSYFFYQYFSYSLGWAYNNYFLIYILIYAASLIALVYTILTIDIRSLSMAVSDKFPRKSIAVFLIAVGIFFAYKWLGLIVPSIMNNTVPDLNGQTTLVTQALDLGIIVPFCIFSGILLLKRNAYGYLFSSIVIMKSVTMSLALVAMVCSSLFSGTPLDYAALGIFLALSLVSVMFAVLLLKNVNNVENVPLK